MKGPENLNTEENAKEVIESLSDTEAGKEMEKKPMPSKEQLEENLPEKEGGNFRIAWKDNETGKEGHGEYCLTRETADAWVREMGAKYPNMDHWVEEKPKEEAQE